MAMAYTNLGPFEGTWARTVPDRKFGFIHADGRDWFAHESNLDNVDTIDGLRPGDVMAFTGYQTPKGLRAEEIRLIKTAAAERTA